MKKIPKKVAAELKKILQKYPLIGKVVKKIDQAGGKSFLVGGAVRDLFLNLPIKDIDIEVHGLTLDKLSGILKRESAKVAESVVAPKADMEGVGWVDLVGKSFGVLKIHGLDIDWSIPRKDSSGRKPTVILDPEMSLKDAFRRRDLTINSMGINLITDELVDPFDGLKDLENKTLRATDSEFFVEDPLRLFRVMQFISRFEFVPDKKLDEICKKMDVSKVSRERIETEFEKLLLKSKQPSSGIRWLKKIGRLKDIFPELYATIGVEQDSKWHPEGDVFEHTMQTLAAMAQLDYQYNKMDAQIAQRVPFEHKRILLYAALCHDLGKITTTEIVDGKIRSIGHDRVGVKFAKLFLKRITNNKDLIKAVCLLVKYHLEPSQFIKNKASSSAYKRLANKLAPFANLEMLSLLAIADKLGRKKGAASKSLKYPEDIDQFIEKAKRFGVYENIEKPLLQGRDFLDIIKPGPRLGDLVKEAYKIQIDKNIKNKNELKKLVLSKEKNHE